MDECWCAFLIAILNPKAFKPELAFMILHGDYTSEKFGKRQRYRWQEEDIMFIEFCRREGTKWTEIADYFGSTVSNVRMTYLNRRRDKR